MINLQRIYDQIEEFHTAFKAPKGSVNKQLRHDMLLSELEEFEAEIKDGESTVNAYKELCDIMYVIAGTAYLHDIKPDHRERLECEEVIKDSKRVLVNKSREEGILWSLNYAKAQNKHYLLGLGNKEYYDCTPEKYLEIRVHHAIYVVFLIAKILEIYDNGAFNELFDEVHASNMSKLDNNGEPIINDGIINPNEPIGKVLKSSNYRKANILPILQKHKIKEVS